MSCEISWESNSFLRCEVSTALLAFCEGIDEFLSQNDAAIKAESVPVYVFVIPHNSTLHGQRSIPRKTIPFLRILCNHTYIEKIVDHMRYRVIAINFEWQSYIHRMLHHLVALISTG